MLSSSSLPLPPRCGPLTQQNERKRILFIVDGDKDDEGQRIETARMDAKPAAAVKTCGFVDFARFIG